jgi:hypothetical protein
VVWLSALICLLFGFRTGAAAWVNWLCCALMLGIAAPNEGFQQAACDSVTIGIAFLLIFLPKLTDAVCRWILAAYLSAIYLDSGAHKILSPMWSGGFGAAVPMTFPSLVWIPAGWMAWFPSWVWHGMGYGVVGFEVLFWLLFLCPYTRVPALLAGIFMHAAIGIVYPIPVFGWIMISLYAGLLPATWYRPVERFVGKIPQKTASPNLRTITGIAVAYGLSVIAVYAPGYLPIKAVRKAAWLIAGVASHEVFAEGAFSRYDYQLRLVGMDGRAEPYSRGNLLNGDVRDRVWELWWKRTEAPPVPIGDAEAHLAAWARFYWNEKPCRIEGRMQVAVTRAIETDLFRKNDSIPWRQIGTIQFGSVQWDSAPQSEQEKFGDYMDRVLR